VYLVTVVIAQVELRRN